MTGRVIVLRGDAAHLPLPDESADLIVTSPPYFNQRAYTDAGVVYEGQVGIEPTPGEYLRALWACTAEWVRVLKPGGSMFVNLGDKHSDRGSPQWRGSSDGYVSRHGKARRANTTGFVPRKSLMGLPWRYALGCIGGYGTALGNPDVVKVLLRDVALGIITLAEAEQVVDELAAVPASGLGVGLRAEVIWAKPSAMPESVTDRVRRCHEQVFHFTKSSRYFAAVDEIREPHRMRPQRRPHGHRQRQQLGVLPAQTYSTSQRDSTGVDGHPLGALPGSVIWEIPSVPLILPEWLEHRRCCGGRKQPGCTDGLRHHAAFPPALVRQCVLGWSPAGICTACGQGRRPVTDKAREVFHGNGRHVPGAQQVRDGAAVTGFTQTSKWTTAAVITGYACDCPDTVAPVRPAVVLDPMGGTGTTALVAAALGRTGITVDMSGDYCDLAAWRTADPGERARALGMPKPPPQPEGHPTLFDDLGSEAS